jgi:hypothetical protein
VPEQPFEQIDSSTSEREIARIFRVPYWLLTGEPKPKLWRAPVARLRAWWWSRRGLFEELDLEVLELSPDSVLVMRLPAPLESHAGELLGKLGAWRDRHLPGQRVLVLGEEIELEQVPAEVWRKLAGEA